MQLQGSWAVTYQDGSTLAQWDSTHPKAVEGEVPFREINWAAVDRVRFESRWASAELVIPAPDEGFAWSMRSRSFTNVKGDAVLVYLIVLSRADEEVNEETTKYALYWVPDGATHETTKFWSKEVADYVGGLLFGQDRELVDRVVELNTDADTTLQ